ncbi:hypothetical protein TASIC1_0001088800 [Trichoderma asperellum]|uniref:Uncharacterized protein n=1 Tax=Trichoderma asperellum TaxID=101201 RepID=A0A6V8QLT2_TRIAP|nr:hypothetical protein TASIC1_0001088800 [Trichoderma asperellum]
MYSEAPFFPTRFTVQSSSSQQRGGLHPEQRYSAPVAGKAAGGHKGAQRRSTLASARSPAPASTLTPTPRVRHAAQAAQLESYLDYGASRSAEVGVRPSTSCQLEYRQRQALVPRQGTRCGGDVAGTGTGTQCRPERRQPRRCPCAVASVPAALSVLTVGQLKGPWPKYALLLEYDAAPNRMPYLQGCAPPVL